MAQTEAQKMLAQMAGKRQAEQLKQLEKLAAQARHAARCKDCS